MTDEKNDLQISIIIPVYNRPDEVRELLESIRVQSVPVYEVIIVEDGSTISCKSIACTYKKELNLHYFYKENSGPGQSRNYGVEHARGNYFIFLDSDCILPADYMRIVNKYLEHNYSDAFGGPDAAHPNFTRLQKAINFSMTSFLTTGGLRGGNENFHTFEPRSFNMGMSSGVYDATRGFSDMRFGEDIDLSRRIVQHGFKSVLIKEAFVYHKRRSTLRQFFKQIFNSGIARIALYKKYPDSLRFFHFSPAIFTMYTLCTPLLCVCLSSSISQ